MVCLIFFRCLSENYGWWRDRGVFSNFQASFFLLCASLKYGVASLWSHPLLSSVEAFNLFNHGPQGVDREYQPAGCAQSRREMV